MKAIIALFICALLVSSTSAATLELDLGAVATCLLSATYANCNLLTLLGAGAITANDDIDLSLASLINPIINGSITAKSLKLSSLITNTVVDITQGSVVTLAEGLEVGTNAAVNAAGTLVANTKSTVAATGRFIAEAGSIVTFNGGVDVATSTGDNTGLTVETGATVNINGNSAINGALRLAEGAFFNIKSGVVTLANNIESAANTTVNSVLAISAAAASYTQTKGNLIINGAAAAVNSSVTIASGATLRGDGGSINGNLNVGANGAVAIGNSPGTNYVNGNFALSSTSTFDLEIASASSYDRLIVKGTAAVNGILVGKLLNNYKPPAGEQYRFITAIGQVSGSFSIVRGDDLANLGKFSTQVNDHSVDAFYANSAATAFASFFLIAVAFVFATL